MTEIKCVVIKAPLDKLDSISEGLRDVSIKGLDEYEFILMPLDSEFLIGDMAEEELERIHKTLHELGIK